MLATFLLPALLGATASAGNGSEISLAWSRLNSPDDSWSAISDDDLLHASGLRVGYGLSPHFSVLAGWQRGLDGGAIWAGEGDDDYDYYENDWGDAELSLATHRFSLGPKARVELFPWFVPYATVQGALLWGTMKIDDDLEDDENLNQIRSGGLSPGVLGTAGVEIVLLRSDRLIRPALGFEAGYGWLAPLRLEPAGALDFHGFTASWTVGARF